MKVATGAFTAGRAAAKASLSPELHPACSVRHQPDAADEPRATSRSLHFVPDHTDQNGHALVHPSEARYARYGRVNRASGQNPRHVNATKSK